jgi:hypothetical protein
MATIHNTTLAPSKLEVLTAWLPSQPWYLDAGQPPKLSKAGGFRLDDPAGEVGIEFMVVRDAADGDQVAYHVPMTYRDAAEPGMEAGFIGTMEHGVLGTRYVYDAAYDWVFVTQVVALMQGHAQAQAQSSSDTADPTVRSRPALSGSDIAVTACALASNGPDGTRLRVSTTEADGAPTDLLVRLVRALPARPAPVDERGGFVQIPWRPGSGAESTAVVITAAETNG